LVVKINEVQAIPGRFSKEAKGKRRRNSWRMDY